MKALVTNGAAIEQIESYFEKVKNIKKARRQLQEMTGAEMFLTSQDGSVVVFLANPLNKDGLLQVPRDRSNNELGLDAYMPDPHADRGSEILDLMRAGSMPLLSIKSDHDFVVLPMTIKDGKMVFTSAQRTDEGLVVSAAESAFVGKMPGVEIKGAAPANDPEHKQVSGLRL